ncbi:hypothetical protein FHS43_002119 [Streptosporangium becharense]|uniref:Uncharacterized protein n=1 Tax=Streptosporangium becharense TaxID=1816182 RepID=A0A7W9IC64_9ACTN|nr:hypothetical protein [Streptosporangium becharense]MBB5817551.1 hypothetical protein [Streptosporangium becharense]
MARRAAGSGRPAFLPDSTRSSAALTRPVAELDRNAARPVAGNRAEEGDMPVLPFRSRPRDSGATSGTRL